MLQQQAHHVRAALKRAASQNGVAPTSSGAKLKSLDERRVGVQVSSGAFGSAPWASERAHHPLVAAHDRGVQGGKAGRRGVRVGALLEQELDQVARSRRAPPAPWR